MSGGYFDYHNYVIRDFAEKIEDVVESNDDETLDEYGTTKGRNLSPEVIEKFQEAIYTLRQASKMLHRVDWLLSGDDSEESFLRRWYRNVPNYWCERFKSKQ